MTPVAISYEDNTFDFTVYTIYMHISLYVHTCNSYTKGMSALLDIYALAQGLQARGKVCINQAKHKFPGADPCRLLKGGVITLWSM